MGELSTLRRESENEADQLREKVRNEKKYFGEKVGELEKENRDLNELLRNK